MDRALQAFKTTVYETSGNQFREPFPAARTIHPTTSSAGQRASETLNLIPVPGEWYHRTHSELSEEDLRDDLAPSLIRTGLVLQLSFRREPIHCQHVHGGYGLTQHCLRLYIIRF